MAKYVDAEKLKKLLDTEYKKYVGKSKQTYAALQYQYIADGLDIAEQVIDSLQQEQTDMGEVSDGYHTFNELYYYRMLYNAAFFNLLPKEWVHKSKRHHTGEECFGGGWFIVMANLPTGQISNHYELKDWDLFQVPEKEFADEWDGHTPQEAAERLYKYLKQEQPKIVNEIWHDVTETPSIFGFYLVIHEKGWCVANYMGKGTVCESGWVEAIHHIEIEHPQKWLDLIDLILKKQQPQKAFNARKEE